MPSPTLMIRPTSDVTSSALKSLSRDLITSVMSWEPMLNFSFPFLQSLDQHMASQMVAERRAETRTVERLQPAVLAELGGEVASERSPVRLGEGDGRPHGRPNP